MEVKTTGWRPTCECEAGEPIPATVLDPFHGSGTSAQVSVANRRSYIGVDISAEYLDAHDRISGVQIKLI